MIRGTFANIRLKNHLAPGTEGGWTRLLEDSKPISIYEAAMQYQEDKTDLIVIAGKEYGTGSSRDWAAKGAALLGVKAVIAESYERIHRSNLIGMGVLPLQFENGENAEQLDLNGFENYSIQNIEPSTTHIDVLVTENDGASKEFKVRVRIDTPKEWEYFQHGGILHYMIRQLLG
tara:strand:- start:167 stop:691 length:525 start_codon:yes stop_codon:yes gene_type:complete